MGLVSNAGDGGRVREVEDTGGGALLVCTRGGGGCVLYEVTVNI